MNWKSIFTEIIVCLLVVLFIYTGISKMMDFANFKFQLGRSPFINKMSGLISLTLPGGELAIALMLVFRRFRLAGLYLSYFLMVLFTGYVWLMLNYAYDLPCSCGGVIAQLSWKDHLTFNAVFSILALTGVLLQTGINGERTLKRA